MFRGLLRPGQGFRKFTVMRRGGNLTQTGRPITGKLTACGEIIGIISQASQHEKEQWKQSGHPISHTIVQRGAAYRAKATDVLAIGSPNGNRYFLVQGTHNPGELDHFMVYYVEEREDLQ